MNKTVSHILILLFGVFCLSSCENELAKNEMKDWLKDPKNSFRQEKKVGEYDISLQLIPKELKDYQQTEKELVFELVISSVNKEEDIRQKVSTEVSQEIENYYSFSAENAFSLESLDKVYRPVLYNYQKGADLALEYRMIVVFSLDKLDDFTLSFDPDYPSIGNTKFKFNKSKILKKPNLKS